MNLCRRLSPVIGEKKAMGNRIRKTVLLIGCLSLLFGVLSQSASAQDASDREARMKWWREARFGMFVHWGLYSGLAGTWEGKQVGKKGGMEWIQNRVRADSATYAQAAKPLFQPSEGFATHWAKLAKQAGCKYVVFTTKHHDGFCLHDSSVSDFDAKDYVDRDLCKEIVEACRAEGLKVGFYHSVIDWHHRQYDFRRAKGLPYPVRSSEEPRDHDQYVDYLHQQVEELMTKYGDVDIVWWDYSKEKAQGPFWKSDALMKLVRKHQPNIVSNNRLYKTASLKNSDKKLALWNPEQGDFTTPEQHVPSTGLAGVDWEVCMTMNTTWGYSEHDQAWKPDEKLIQTLVDIVSKGGNYLLNIGPKGDGSVPDQSVRSMEAIGRWMAVNGESICGTGASPIEKPEWGRYTIKDNTLYAHVFDWPDTGQLEIKFKDQPVSRAYLLADRNTELAVGKTDGGFVVTLPKSAPDKIASVVAVELKTEKELPAAEAKKE